MSEQQEQEKEVQTRAEAGPVGRSLRIVQISDPHLFSETDKKLAGLNCQDSLDQVLALVRRQQADQLDLVLCTGDLAQEASAATYQRFYSIMQSLGAPHRWIPGNHDKPQVLREAVGEGADCLEKVVEVGQWRVIMLDSSVAGQVYGHLSTAELDFLRESLEQAWRREQYVLICVHHNPLPVQAAWLQQHALKNAEEFLAVIDQYPAVRAVLWGHVHQEVNRQRKGVRMLAAPSTCVQFHPDNDEFTLDPRNPGYRWLELRPDGTLRTAVERVSGVTFDVDFSSTGY